MLGVDRVDDLDQATVVAHAHEQRIALLVREARPRRRGTRRRAAESPRSKNGRTAGWAQPRHTSATSLTFLSRSAGARRAAGSAGTAERAAESTRRQSGAARLSAPSARWGTRPAGSRPRSAQSNSSTITAKSRSSSGQERNRSVRTARKPLVTSLTGVQNSACPTTLPARETQRRDAGHLAHPAALSEARGLDVRVALGGQSADLEQVLGRVRQIRVDERDVLEAELGRAVGAGAQRLAVAGVLRVLDDVDALEAVEDLSAAVGAAVVDRDEHGAAPVLLHGGADGRDAPHRARPPRCRRGRRRPWRARASRRIGRPSSR